MSERDAAAHRVAAIINEAERAMDAAMARASQLLTELPALQGQAGLNGAWAQPAVASVCAALTDMTGARASLISAHKSLSAVQRKLGVTVAEGTTGDKEDAVRPTGRQADTVVHLRA
jgi:hypothetical protein